MLFDRKTYLFVMGNFISVTYAELSPPLVFLVVCEASVFMEQRLRNLLTQVFI